MSFDTAHLVAFAAAIVAGFVRGFTGFGSALIFMPLASAAFSPQLAAPVLLVTDFVMGIPLVVSALREVRWRTVLPAAIGAIITTPLGAHALAHGDPLILRWAISAIVLALLLLLVSGWRYHGEPRPVPSLGVGATAGFLGGFGQVSGPPVVAYWISGPDPTAIIRANLLCFFAVISLSSLAAYVWNGLYTGEVVDLFLVLAPGYAIALLIGAKVFRRTAGAAYRPFVYVVIAIAALTSMPLFDGVLR
ncbi:MAG: sulfite exporter TauE/SafE family protein [Bauldia sp.]|nr:sulfite exporter TauE/SafE family protein [Bauldia sp.]